MANRYKLCPPVGAKASCRWCARMSTLFNSRGKPSNPHAELLAIHEAVMNPQAVVINKADTFTVKMVKEFILRALLVDEIEDGDHGRE